MIRTIIYYLAVFCRKMYTKPLKPRRKLHDAASFVVMVVIAFSLINFLVLLEYVFEERGIVYFLISQNVIGYALGVTLFLVFYVLKSIFTRPIGIVEKRRRLRKICQQLSSVQPWHSRAVCVSGIPLLYISFMFISVQLILKYNGL